jgi:hypothetical protein
MHGFEALGSQSPFANWDPSDWLELVSSARRLSYQEEKADELESVCSLWRQHVLDCHDSKHMWRFMQGELLHCSG